MSDATSTNTADWACIRQHESNDNYAEGNGGAYQFEFGTWTALTGLPSPAEDYPPAVQDAAALKLLFTARLGAVEHPLRLRAVRTRP